MSVHEADERVDRTRLATHVRVEQQHVASVAAGDRLVAVGREAERPLVADHLDVGERAADVIRGLLREFGNQRSEKSDLRKPVANAAGKT